MSNSARRSSPASVATLGSIVSAAMLFASPAKPQTPPAPYVCHSALQCVVTVAADCRSVPCTLSVDRENVDLDGHAVVWEIKAVAGQNLLFRIPDGIYFKTEAGRRAFSQCHPESHGQRWWCKGDLTGGTFEYRIELEGTPPSLPLDPWVVNH